MIVTGTVTGTCEVEIPDAPPPSTLAGVVLASGGDDVAAINDALQEFSEVILPSPVYKVSAPIVPWSNTWLRLGHNTIVRPLLDEGHQHHLLANYMATQTSGTMLDENIRVSGGIWDGLSTGYADDGRKGYGMEFWGVDGLHVHDVRLRNIPLSGIEVCGDKAGTAFGVRAAPNGSSVPPLKCIDVLVERVKMKHIGWQEQYLANPDGLIEWGDAGFGLIARAPARNVVFRDITGRDVMYGIAGVGQLCNLNNSEKVEENLAQVIGAVLDSIYADQTGYPCEAPSIRAAFCRDVRISNSLAVGNIASGGISLRQAGSTPVQRVAVNSCQSRGNAYGLIATGASSSVFVEDVSVTGGHYTGNLNDGAIVEDYRVLFSAVNANGNGRYGFNLTALTQDAIRASLQGCTARDNGTLDIRLDDVTRCTLTGNSAGTIQESGAADWNIIASNQAAVTKCGANTIAPNNI